jgi:hypothetical protein
MRYILKYDGSRSAANQYINLRDWLLEHDISHRFEWDYAGRYTPNAVVIDNEEDATLFVLSMTKGITNNEV